MGVFERLLGPRSLECPKALLVCWWVAFPIFSWGVRLIFSKVIALVAYLWHWALVAPVIASRFFVGAIGASNSRPLPFQAHLKLAQELSPPGVTTCVPHFEQLVEKGANCF